ncbi:hypothetical protein RND71_025051 [Anisodus tanguticus]|uniref:MIF4G domain-containing protein n=1 Tax=Anisodus tanguticus TaxID=243964 RepID=A0AAE1VD31_9SOLA|nr:hypothetical protein RND71_025051 [Anisodus tanguticus]
MQLRILESKQYIMQANSSQKRPIQRLQPVVQTKMEHPDDEGRVGVEHSEKHEDELMTLFSREDFLVLFVVLAIIYTCIFMKEVVARHEEFKKSVEEKMILRQNNLNPERPVYFFNNLPCQKENKFALPCLEVGGTVRLAEALDMQPPVMPEDGHTQGGVLAIRKADVLIFHGHSDRSLLSDYMVSCVIDTMFFVILVEFCYLNSKSSRKKLVRALFNVPRTLLELFLYYSRMVSTLSTCMNDYHMNIETKIRNIRFIGELSKFRIAPPDLVFSYLKACLDDFSYHNIDVAFNLLEICGHFLYRSPKTTIRMANMLEIMIRLKNVKNLDPLHITLVENAYYLIKPLEKSARVSKVRSPLHQGQVCQIHLIASLTIGLSRYHDDFSVAVVDEIYLMDELNPSTLDGKYDSHVVIILLEPELSTESPRPVARASITDIRLVPTPISSTWHGLVNGFPQDVLDPPEDYFRIRMVITLLETCGHYFDRGSSKKKLDRFLIQFQRYILNKCVLPLDIEFDLQDLFAELCRNMMRYASIEEVNVALVDLEEHERIVTSEKANNEKHSEIEKIPSMTTSVISVNGQILANGIEENGLHEEIVEIESDTESGTIEHVGHDDDEETDDRNRDDRGDIEDESDEGNRSGSDEEDKVHVRSKVAEVNPLEEEEFERELRALMQAIELEEKQDIKRLVLEYNDREEEELNGLGNQLPSWTQSSGSMVAHRGNTWDAPEEDEFKLLLRYGNGFFVAPSHWYIFVIGNGKKAPIFSICHLDFQLRMLVSLGMALACL